MSRNTSGEKGAFVLTDEAEDDVWIGFSKEIAWYLRLEWIVFYNYPFRHEVNK